MDFLVVAHKSSSLLDFPRNFFFFPVCVFVLSFFDINLYFHVIVGSIQEIQYLQIQ